MLTHHVEDGISQLHVDIVRLTPEAFGVIKGECDSPTGIDLGAFIVQYDWHTAIILPNGDEIRHRAFMQHVNALL